MRGLLYNQFFTFRLPLGAIFGSQIFAMLVALLGGNDYSVQFGMNVCLIVPYIIFMLTNSELFHYDEREKWCCFAVSTPLSFKGQVAAKYLFSLGINVLTLLTALICCGIMSAFTGENLISMMRTGLVAFGLTVTLNAFEFPFYFRFGSEHGSQIKAASIGVVLLAVCIYGLFGDISFLFSDTIVQDFINIMNGTFFRTFSAVIPAISVGLLFLSFWISTPLYRKGMECYEK
ncbi:MAG: ABC-2 transporter permease [Oscillospiraceae bacterium]|nr:ABC-2 transporter permease [Oscillospiraceae bacterium]